MRVSVFDTVAVEIVRAEIPREVRIQNTSGVRVWVSRNQTMLLVSDVVSGLPSSGYILQPFDPGLHFDKFSGSLYARSETLAPGNIAEVEVMEEAKAPTPKYDRSPRPAPSIMDRVRGWFQSRKPEFDIKDGLG